jgi:glycosyltransferase involved in cell wall biosynthesis
MTTQSPARPERDTSLVRLPRVLIISTCAASTFLGGGVTIEKLFARWPSGSLAQIHSDWFEPKDSVCENFYSVNGPFFNPRTPWWAWHLSRAAAWAVGRGEHGVFWSRLTPALRRWIDDFSPEVIYSQAGNLAFSGLTKQICDYTGVPLVLHTPDDWVTDWPTNVLGKRFPVLSAQLAARVTDEFTGLSARAKARLAIGSKMARVYGERYGGSWQPFYNSIDPTIWPATPLRDEFTPVRPFRVLYSGSLLGYSALAGVLDAAEAVSRLRAEGLPIELMVATHERDQVHRKQLERYEGVRVAGMVPLDQLPARLASADLLLLPVTFDPKRLNFIRLSVHAKTAEYMASGTPIVVYGPGESAIVEYAAEEGWAYVVSTAGAGYLAEAFRSLMVNPEARRSLSRRGRALALRDFDINKVRPRFEALIMDVARDGTDARPLAAGGADE